MEILDWNILGIVLLVSFVVFLTKFYKNHNDVEETKYDEVKMNVKIIKIDPNEINFSNSSQDNYNKSNKNNKNNKNNYNQDIYSGTTQKITYNDYKQNDICFIKTPTIFKLSNPRLLYIAHSNNSRYYAILSNDIKSLDGIIYEIVKNINQELRSKNDFTSSNILSVYKDLILKQKEVLLHQ